MNFNRQVQRHRNTDKDRGILKSFMVIISSYRSRFQSIGLIYRLQGLIERLI